MPFEDNFDPNTVDAETLKNVIESQQAAAAPSAPALYSSPPTGASGTEDLQSQVGLNSSLVQAVLRQHQLAQNAQESRTLATSPEHRVGAIRQLMGNVLTVISDALAVKNGLETSAEREARHYNQGVADREMALREQQAQELHDYHQEQLDIARHGARSESPGESIIRKIREAQQSHLSPDETKEYVFGIKPTEDTNTNEMQVYLDAAGGNPIKALQLKRDDELAKARAGRQPQQQRLEADQQAVEAAAQSLASGDLSRLKDISSLRGSQRLLIYNRAKEINPNFNTAEIDRQIKMEDYYANGKGADNLRSFNIFLEHAGAASDQVNAFRNANSPLINKPLTWLRKNALNDPSVSAYLASLEPVRKEFEGFLLGGRALYADDRKQAETILSDDATPAQQQAALKALGHTAKARFNEENFRYKKLMKRDLPDPFSPEAQEGANKIGVDITSPPNQGSGRPISLSDFKRKHGIR